MAASRTSFCACPRPLVSWAIALREFRTRCHGAPALAWPSSLSTMVCEDEAERHCHTGRRPDRLAGPPRPPRRPLPLASFGPSATACLSRKRC